MREVGGELSESELLAQITTLGQAFLSGLLAAFTIVSAYVVALYTFLAVAPPLLKVTAFAFFTVTMLLLGIFLMGTIIYADGVAAALSGLAFSGKVSNVGHLVARLLNHWATYSMAVVSTVIGVALYVALYYLTFHHDWSHVPHLKP